MASAVFAGAAGSLGETVAPTSEAERNVVPGGADGGDFKGEKYSTNNQMAKNEIVTAIIT